MISVTFGRPEYLAFLIALPLLIISHFLLYRFTKRKAMHFANMETLKRVTGVRVRTSNYFLLFLRVVSLIALVLALADITIWQDGEIQNSDYILAIDTSASMTATDIEPTRLDAAKQTAISFVEGLDRTGKVGVVSFAGLSKIETPLSGDDVLIAQSIEDLKADLSSGTDIGGAIITATNLLVPSDRGRTIILFTDGSNTIGTSLEDPVTTGVAYAQEYNVQIHAVGIGSVGSSAGSYLPALYNATAVYSKEDLEYITNQTNGLLIEATNMEPLNESFDSLFANSQLSRKDTSLATPLMLLVLLLLFVDWGLSNTKMRLIP